MIRLLKLAPWLLFGLSFVATSFAQIIPPQGRLTLQSGTPVMTADVNGATAIYYAPYVGDSIPINTGSSSWTSQTFSSGLSMNLSSTYQTAGNIYDIFAYVNSGTLYLCADTQPWGSLSSRGSSAAIALVNGVWVSNQLVLDLYCGTVVFDGAEGYPAPTYLGSIYMTGNGETTVNMMPSAAPGGSNNVIGLWNAYNRVPIKSLEHDSNTNWTYASNTWRAMDGSNSNRVTYLDGLGQSFVTAKVMTIAYNSTAGGGPMIGISQNVVSGSTLQAAYIQISPGGSADGANTFGTDGIFPPALGLNYLQAVEQSFSSTTSTFAFNGNNTYLLYEGEY
jgi:hypothetical protein